MITVYTANVGGYDRLLPPLVVNPVCRYLCYTDHPEYVPHPWEILPVAAGLGAPRSVRIHKLLSHRYAMGEYSIWHDANFQLAADPVKLCERYLAVADIAVFRHPKRSSLYEEGESLVSMKFPRPIPIKAQMIRYRKVGCPPSSGLWACGIILRRHTFTIASLNAVWWSEVCKGSERDQISFPYALWKLGIKPFIIPGSVFKSSEFIYHKHLKGAPCQSPS